MPNLIEDRTNIVVVSNRIQSSIAELHTGLVLRFGNPIGYPIHSMKPHEWGTSTHGLNGG